ncbi:ketoacyl-ACP synthase III [Marinifilum sp. JC120]|nr:ketoacyl-ACP synthase III [Marinifilum sp. JC120]
MDYYLPENILVNDALGVQFPDWDIAKAEKKIGIKQRHIAAKDETALDLGEKAARKVLKRIDGDVDFILFCTETPDYAIPPNATLLQSRLGLSTSIGAYDFNLGCSGFVFGLAQAKGLICSGIARRVLLVTAETYSKVINPLDKGNRIIFGDAAAACILEKSNESGIGEFVFGTDGSQGMTLAIPNSGMRSTWDPEAALIKDRNGNGRTENDLYMDGPGIFNFTLDRVPELYAQTLARNDLDIESLDLVLFHQANRFMLNHLRMKMQIPADKFVVDMEGTGNTVSSSIPIALKNICNNTDCTLSILLAGFGVGLSWAGTVVTINSCGVL